MVYVRMHSCKLYVYYVYVYVCMCVIFLIRQYLFIYLFCFFRIFLFVILFFFFFFVSFVVFTAGGKLLPSYRLQKLAAAIAISLRLSLSLSTVAHMPPTPVKINESKGFGNLRSLLLRIWVMVRIMRLDFIYYNSLLCSN